MRQGMLRVHGWKPFEFIGYWDADLATPLEAVHAMCRLAGRQAGVSDGARLAHQAAGERRSTARPSGITWGECSPRSPALRCGSPSTTRNAAPSWCRRRCRSSSISRSSAAGSSTWSCSPGCGTSSACKSCSTPRSSPAGQVGRHRRLQAPVHLHAAGAAGAMEDRPALQSIAGRTLRRHW